MLVILLPFSVALAQTQLASQPPQPWPLPVKNGPLAPHMRLCAPQQRIKWMANNPPSKRV